MSIEEQLAQDVDPKFVSERKGLDYVTGRYVKQRLNEVFGPLGWSFTIQEQHVLSIDDEAVRFLVHGRLKVHHGEQWNVKDAIAVGHGVLKSRGQPVSPSRASEVIDFAAAEAVTDALKRAAVSLGQTLGLNLYPMVAGEKDKKKSTPARKPAPKPTKPKSAPKPTVETEEDDW